MKLFILPILIFFCACDEKPTTYTETVVGRGLWMTTRTGSSGRLVRLDRDNLKETKIGHNQIFSDAVLIPRPNSGIFMLTRMGSDSIQIFDGEYGHLSAEIALPAGDLSDGYIVPYNPQFALLDNSNQVWVVGQNSNTIHVFDINNNKLINSIALDDNKSDFFIKNDGSDHYLEPAIIVAPNEDEIVVIAQRLRRYYNGGWDWVPAEESAMVVIDKDSLSIKTIQYLPISNPIKAFVDSSHSWPIITVIGAGSLNNHPINGSIAQISSKDYSVIDEKFFPFSIFILEVAKYSGEIPINWIAFCFPLLIT